jgi:hypothetical protein
MAESRQAGVSTVILNSPELEAPVPVQETDQESLPVMRILWPSFLVAAAATGVFFSVFDPQELHVFGFVVPPHRMAAYTVGFIAFWMMGAMSSTMTWLLFRKPSNSVVTID